MARGFIMLDIEGLELTSADRTLLRSSNVGGVILFSRNYESPNQIINLISEIRKIQTPSLLIAVDHEGGRVQRFRNGFTKIPSMRHVGHLYDQNQAAAHELAFFIGWIIGAELRAIGVDLCFGPCVDLDWGSSAIIGDRSFHRDKRIVEELSYKFTRGLKSAGMQAVAKHFPGHGFVVNDSHEQLPIDRRDFSELLDDIYPYEGLIRKQAISAIMMSHIIYKQTDSMPASISEYWIKNHLRQQLGFNGVVFCDDLSMKALCAYGNLTQRATLALKASCDMLIMCNDREGSEETVKLLKDYHNPSSMLRLARLRGKKSISREQLLDSKDWSKATSYLNSHLQQSNFELSG
jgi:beta-N-acetylhexosaminidase